MGIHEKDEQSVLKELSQPLRVSSNLGLNVSSDLYVCSTPRHITLSEESEADLYGELARKGLISMEPIQDGHNNKFFVEITETGAAVLGNVLKYILR